MRRLLEGMCSGATVRADVVVRHLVRTCRLELISVLHDTVNEEGAVDARRVVHAFAAAAVPLLFVVVALAEGAKFNGKIGQGRGRGTYSW